MGREVPFCCKESQSFTPNEPWSDKREVDHFYNAQADFAIERLKGPGNCLVIGSPIFEAQELAKSMSISYLDVRKPPHDVGHFIQADATDMPLEDASFDSVSSTCVLCHAGLGRYGDPLVEDGDVKMLNEISRVLKPGGLAALTFGPVAEIEALLRLGTFQRVYTMKEALRMASEAKLEVLETKVYQWGLGWFDYVPVSDALGLHYLSMLLRK